jgi:hypothetical protein
MFNFLRRNDVVVRDMLADVTNDPRDRNSRTYHPTQYVSQPLNNPGGVRNLAYANLSLPRDSCIGQGVMVERMMRPCTPKLMQAGQAVITSTYGRQVTGVTSSPLYDRDSGKMAYGQAFVANVYPYCGGDGSVNDKRVA